VPYQCGPVRKTSHLLGLVTSSTRGSLSRNNDRGKALAYSNCSTEGATMSRNRRQIKYHLASRIVVIFFHASVLVCRIRLVDKNKQANHHFSRILILTEMSGIPQCLGSDKWEQGLILSNIFKIVRKRPRFRHRVLG